MKIFVIFIFMISGFIYAQEEEIIVENKHVKPKFNHEINFGGEVDIVPFFNKGYDGTFWMNIDNWRIRANSSKFSPPEFVRNNNFKNLTISNLSLMCDYFPIGEKTWIDRLFFSAGGAYWHNEAWNSKNKAGNFKSWLFSFGVGYVRYISEHFYISPYFQGHLRVAGDKEVIISGENYKTQFFTPDISITLGFQF